VLPPLMVFLYSVYCWKALLKCTFLLSVPFECCIWWLNFNVKTVVVTQLISVLNITITL
jgi:hypothetical protein